MSKSETPRLTISYGKLVGSKMMPPTVGLQVYGPTVRVRIGLHSHLAAARTKQGIPIPTPVEGDALIDSGATATTIDSNVAKKLSLQPSGQVTSYGIGGESTDFTVGCSVDIRGLLVDIPRCHCHDLSTTSSKLIALIGRDVLRHMVFHYDGPKGEVYLELVSSRSPTPQRPHARTRGKKRKPKRKRRK